MKRKTEKSNRGNDFAGSWRIYKMEDFDKVDIDMECQAYIRFDSRNMGEFQFILVHGDLDGEIVRYGDKKRLEFTWEGNDECDPASGSGWAMINSKGELEGKIKIHGGDSSLFWARIAK